MTNFSLEFLQAVSDWQKGGDATKKGARIKRYTPDLPQKFLNCDAPCYRQEAHDKVRVWQLLADNCLPERIASWTLDLDVAKQFKGGPASGLQGVIFRIVPPAGVVVLNLAQLYLDHEFLDAVERFKGQIKAWDEGGGRYEATQREVILELDSVNAAAVLHYGGFIGSLSQLAQELHGSDPTSNELDDLSRKLAERQLKPGDPWWLTEESTY